MSFYHDDDDYAPLATPADACREHARIVGAERPDQEWLLTDYDTWEKNPHFTGTPGRHPEDYDDDYELLDEATIEANKKAAADFQNYLDNEECPF
jgi:hypothetical protein